MPADDVGVVIPAYNAGRFLKETLDAILAQTLPVAACVVVDDGSTDETAAVAEAAPDPVRVVRQENEGVSAARNRGMRELTTPWIAFCDADDVWRPGKLESQVEAMIETPSAAAALTGATRIGPDGAELDVPHTTWSFRDLTLCDLVHHRPGRIPMSIPSTLMASRAVLSDVGRWDEELSDAADWDYLIRIRKRGGLTGPAEPLVSYRIHPDAMSGDVEGRVRDVIRLFRKVRNDPEIVRRCGEDLDDAWGWQVRVMAASCWRAGNKRDALGLVVRELFRHPASVTRALLE